MCVYVCKILCAYMYKSKKIIWLTDTQQQACSTSCRSVKNKYIQIIYKLVPKIMNISKNN